VNAVILLLSGVGVIAGVAVLAVYWSRSRVSNESRVVAALRSYAGAQSAYVQKDWDGDGVRTYARNLRQLGDAGLIPEAMAAARGPAGVPYYGYLFLECKTIGKQPIDWKVDYGLCAVPAEYGRSGYRSFIVATNGTVFPKDQGQGGTFERDYPANPVTSGWFSCEE
jgi:hypothetical protein